MPIPVDFAPPPQFDRSMISYVTTNFGRVRDALARAMGGDYRTGLYTWAFTGFAAGLNNVNFSTPFNSAAAPLVIAHTINTGTYFEMNVVFSAPGYFTLSGRTYGGVAAANDAVVKYLAFYP